MLKADGGVVIEVHVEDDKAQKELNNLEKTIEKTEEKISDMGQKKDTAERAVFLSEAELKKETRRLDELKAKLAAAREADKSNAKISALEEKLQSKEAERSPIVEELREATTEAEKTFSTVERLKKALDMSRAATSIKSDVHISPEAYIEEQTRQEQIASELREQEAALKEQEKYAMRLASQDEKQLSSIQKLTQELDTARQQMATMPQTGDTAALESEVQRQQEAVRAIQTEHNKNVGAVERYGAKIEEATQELTRQKEEAGALVNQLYAASTPTAKLGKSIDEAGGFLDKFSKRVKGLARRVFVFTVITAALRSLKTWLSNVVQGNSEAQAAMARLKGALLTLAQPLIQVIIPAFTTLVNILTAIVGKIAAIVSALFGRTAAQSAQAAKNLNSEQKALEGVGGAAEDAAGSLAGFDEINTIQTEDKTGGGGGSGSSEMLPDFSGADALSERLKKIADIVLLIGTGFAMWKIGTSITGTLGNVLQILGGILVSAGGILLAIDGIVDAWKNGVDWGNMAEIITGVVIAAVGLFTIVSKITRLLNAGMAAEELKVLAARMGGIAAGIALVVGGLAMLVLAFKDAMDSGWNLQNTLLAIAGIVATGLGFFFITNSVIPLVIAGIAALLLALTVATGHGEELINGIKEFLQGFVDFFVGIFTGDIDRAVKGIEEIFNGLWQAVEAIWNSLRDVILGFFDWLNEITGGKIAGTLNALKQIFATAFAFISETISGLWNSLKTVLSGIINFIGGVFSGDWSRAWDGIKQIFSGIWSTIVTIAKGGFNLIIVAIETFVNGLIAAFNLVLSGINWIGSLFGASINLQIQPLQIPRLAQGAVIPPNREFMAVLGDQKSGTNIEAPEDLIRKIVREETAGMKNSRPAEVKIYLDRKLLGSVLIDEINDRTIQAGRSVLKI